MFLQSISGLTILELSLDTMYMEGDQAWHNAFVCVVIKPEWHVVRTDVVVNLFFWHFNGVRIECSDPNSERVEPGTAISDRLFLQ